MTRAWSPRPAAPSPTLPRSIWENAPNLPLHAPELRRLERAEGAVRSPRPSPQPDPDPGRRRPVRRQAAASFGPLGRAHAAELDRGDDSRTSPTSPSPAPRRRPMPAPSRSPAPSSTTRARRRPAASPRCRRPNGRSPSGRHATGDGGRDLIGLRRAAAVAGFGLACLAMLAAPALSGAAPGRACRGLVLSPCPGQSVPARPLLIRLDAGVHGRHLRVTLNGVQIGRYFSKPSQHGTRRLSVSASYGLRHGRNRLVVGSVTARGSCARAPSASRCVANARSPAPDSTARWKREPASTWRATDLAAILARPGARVRR